MKRLLLAALLLAPLPAVSSSARADTNIRVGWCARTVSSAAAPFAIATKMGWFAKEGLKVDLAPLPGSTDCTKLVATGELQYALPSIEPLVVLRAQGVKVKNFYTAYQGNIYGIAVPEGSPIKSLADLKGKRIGVTAMASAGVPVARALAAAQGFNPESDIRIVAVGEGGQAAALVGYADGGGPARRVAHADDDGGQGQGGRGRAGASSPSGRPGRLHRRPHRVLQQFVQAVVQVGGDVGQGRVGASPARTGHDDLGRAPVGFRRRLARARGRVLHRLPHPHLQAHRPDVAGPAVRQADDMLRQHAAGDAGPEHAV